MGVLLGLSFMLLLKSKWSWELRFWVIMIFSFLEMKFLNIESSGAYFYYLYMDIVSMPLVMLSFWMTGLMILSSYNSIKFNNNKPYYFSSCVLILCIFLFFFFFVENMIMFYMFFEMTLIPTLLLILGWGYQPERLQAGMYMLLYTVGASLPLLMCLVFISFREGCYNMNFYMYMYMTYMNMYWFVGMLLAFLVKLPLYFFHLWLPKAHVEAPISGSMILAGVLLKLGGYGFMRFMYMFNFSSGVWMKLLMIVCLWGGVLTCIICVGQSDMKSLIAYSSVGHMGLMLAGLISGFIIGWEGAMLMMICHGLCSSGMFCMANLIYEKINSRSLFLCGGMLNYNPMMSMLMFMLCICNMGAPPFINLISEIMLYIAMYMYSSIFLIYVVIMVFLGGLFNLLFYVMIHHGQIMSFMKIMVVGSSSESLLLMLHIIPLLMFMLNISYISKMFF
uniref:NADH dehydrogenase subunit 4 n=1 Tax=Japetella diaphana TaxID=61718 RepID=UPI00226C8E98|nr:NADH dehydrogenase subunit 4 [Japetella diaphana]UZN92533.1 NADH dehydrogenase subunit 4 [Japetella diaphana]